LSAVPAAATAAAAAAICDVCVLCVQVELFYAVVNLYWGVWGFNQARDEGCAEFPYLLAHPWAFLAVTRRC
jgi:hypothetical protein